MTQITVFHSLCENAPEELAEISVLHTISAVYKEPAPGDTMKIGDKEFKITAVGVEAPYTLRELGHCTVNFGGGEEAALPGRCIILKGSESNCGGSAGRTDSIY